MISTILETYHNVRAPYEQRKIQVALHALRMETSLWELYSHIHKTTRGGTRPAPEGRTNNKADPMIVRFYSSTMFRDRVMTEYATAVLPRTRATSLQHIVAASREGKTPHCFNEERWARGYYPGSDIEHDRT